MMYVMCGHMYAYLVDKLLYMLVAAVVLTYSIILNHTHIYAWTKVEGSIVVPWYGIIGNYFY